MTWEEAVRSLIDDPSQRDLAAGAYFDLPLTAAAKRYASGPEWQAIRALTGKPCGVAVDVGAGNGVVSYALACDGWTVIAIEPDPSDLVGAGAIRQLSQATGLAIDVRGGYGEGLPLETGSVALVIARQVLHHARDLQGFCREIARVLAPGGMLVSARDHVITGPGQLQAFLDLHPLHKLYGGENAFELKEYRAAIKNAGLVIEREIGPLESVINYAPHTYATLRAEIANRLGPLGIVAKAALRSDTVMAATLQMFSRVDRRPGRLVSFVARKV